MFKKLLVASAILATSSSLAFAAAAVPDPSCKKVEEVKKPEVTDNGPEPCHLCFLAGPYLGLSFGTRNNWNRHIHRSIPVFDPTTGVFVIHGTNRGGFNFYKGLSGTISLGVATMINPFFYLGGEIYTGDSLRISESQPRGARDELHKDVRSTWFGGIDVITGAMFADRVMGYIRGGIVHTQFEVPDHQGMTGWRFGLGTEMTIIRRWDVRMEYLYSFYSGRHKIRSDEINIGAIYKIV